jgi:phage terminase large subunit
MSSLNVQVPDKLGFLYEPWRYKVAYGGRGATKSWSFADALLVQGHQAQSRNLCAREHMDSIKESVHQLLKDRIDALGLSVAYEIQNTVIRHRFNGTSFSFTGLRINPSDLKSFEAIDRCWVEEAQNVSKRSWDILTPTIRKPGSEIWVSFNTELETDETYQRMVVKPPKGAKVVHIGWQDNPWFSPELEAERVDCLERDPDGYLTIWEGKPRIALEGAVYARELRELIARNGVTRVPYDKTKPVHTAWDLGWGDSMAIVMWQQVGYEYRFLAYLEGRHMTTYDYVIELKKLPFIYGHHYGPHDGVNGNIGSGTSWEQDMRTYFQTQNVHINPQTDETTQIAAVRHVLSKSVFDEAGTTELRNRLARYQYGQHADGSSTRVPIHNAASHGAKALATMAIGYSEQIDRPRIKVGNQSAPSSSSWMAS